MHPFPPFRCPICKSNGYTHVGKSRDGHTVHCCAGCSVVFMDPEAFTRQTPRIGEEHPHVHLVLKAVSEQGVRLNIKKSTLRHWRSEFAHNLRLLGVPANATERAVRGQARKALHDGIYRSSLRGDSVFLRAKAETVAADLRRGHLPIEIGNSTLLKTRGEVESGWQAVAARIATDGDHRLVNEIQNFIKHMLPARTEREWIASQIGKSARLVPIPAR